MPNRAKALTQTDRDIAYGIAAMRRERGIKLIDLAQKIGITDRQLHRYEKAQSRLNLSMARRIATVLDIDVSRLIMAGGKSDNRTYIDRPYVENLLLGQDVLELLEIYNLLDPDLKIIILNFVKGAARVENDAPLPAQLQPIDRHAEDGQSKYEKTANSPP